MAASVIPTAALTAMTFQLLLEVMPTDRSGVQELLQVEAFVARALSPDDEAAKRDERDRPADPADVGKSYSFERDQYRQYERRDRQNDLQLSPVSDGPRSYRRRFASASHQ